MQILRRLVNGVLKQNMPLPNPTSAVAAHILIRGLVQGVGFRYFVQQKAQDAGLSGWVRNLPDGTVETVAEGSESDLRSWIESLRQGPGSARVENLQITWNKPTQLTHFEVRLS
jgi:acylphosphatase